MKQLHDIQLQILKRLLFSDGLKYSRLKPDPEMENNQLDFHLDRLIGEGYVIKGEDGYSLTSFGKEYANRMDTEEVIIAKQSKVGVLICCTRKTGSQLQYLIYTRLKQPFFGCQGFMSGKVRYGEKVIETARRELKEETGLDGNPQIVAIRHYLVFDRSTEGLVEDKFMFLCRVDNPTGGLVPESLEGKYEWVNEQYLKDYVTNHFENFAAFQEQIDLVKNFRGHITLQEIDHETNKF